MSKRVLVATVSIFFSVLAGCNRSTAPTVPPSGTKGTVDGVTCEVFALRGMAVDAVQIGRRGEEPHRVHELLDGDPFEHLDVLENILRHQRLFLTSSRRGDEQTGRGESKSLVHRFVASPLLTPNAGSLIVFM